MTDIRDRLALRKFINAAGPVSVFGGGLPSAEAVEAAVAILSHPIDIQQLQSLASQEIAQAFGCKAGCVTAGSAAGIAMAVAAAMTGTDRARVAQLPDAAGMKSRVVMQRGHDCNFGAQVSQMIRLAGAVPDLIGAADRCTALELRSALDGGGVCAAVFVVSHHTAQNGMIDLATFCESCHAARVPVIVDAAGEHDLRGFLSAGADLVIASAHKNFGALTAGIVAGRAALIESCLMQDAGIGRPMKVGKEGIAGVIAALSIWRRQDRPAVHDEWTKRASHALGALADIPSLKVELARDIDGSPLFRARIHVSGKLNAEQVAQRLIDGTPSVRVWRLGLPRGYFELDPRTVTDEAMAVACKAVRAALLG